MTKLLRFTLLSIFLFASASLTRAQSTLIHYWNFNNLTSAYHIPNVPNIKADYSVIDTNKAYLEYYLIPGTSNSYGGYIDNYPPTSPNWQGNIIDTFNARNGAPPGQALRVRNPVDSIELRWHIPTTGYQNIVVKYALQSSSWSHGDSTQVFSYSPDGGTTWKSTGITVNGVAIDSLNVDNYPMYEGDSGWGLVTVTFGNDQSVNNNPNLIFRIVAHGNANISSGNLRYDNVTVDGDPMGQSLTLIHYWNFNNLTTAYHIPNVPNIKADYSVIDTNAAYLQYYLIPGTSNSYGGYIDNYPPTSPNWQGVIIDTFNARNGAPPGQALRVRNPVDSIELRWHIPTTGYSNIVVKYALQSSSWSHGDSTQVFSYSPDGGTTWKNAGITVNGVAIDSLNVDNYPMYEGDSGWGLVTVTFGNDQSVNNNPNLIFRIVAHGNANISSGNLRYDNVTVEGMGASKPPPAQIAILTPRNGNILVPGQMDTITFTTLNEVGQERTITLSTDGGTSWQPVGTITGGTSYVWTVPNVATYAGMIRVSDSASVTGTSSSFVIYPITSSNRIVHYWDFNTMRVGYHNPNIPAIPADFSATQTRGTIDYVLQPGVSSTYAGYLDPVPGDTVNALFEMGGGQGLRVRNPTDSMELRFVIPTTGYKGISIHYALQTSDSTVLGDAPHKELYDYSVDGGQTWVTTGLTVNGVPATFLNALLPQYGSATAFGPVSISFGSETSMNDNPNFIFRIKFQDSTHGTSGNNRLDNFSVDAASPLNVSATAPELLCSVIPSIAQDHISILSPEGRKNITVTDNLGRTITNIAEGDGEYNYSVRDLASGIYFIHIQTATGAQTTLRFVKE